MNTDNKHMNLIKKITAQFCRKPLLVKPAVSNRSFSKEELELFYLAGYNKAFGRTAYSDHWKIFFDKFYNEYLSE
jgi:hypothetical protein